jgi:hypothetical protein
MAIQNYELLRDWYAIMDGIPDDLINLDSVIKQKGRSLSCGTIACAGGWMALHPTFAERLKPTVTKLPGGHTCVLWLGQQADPDNVFEAMADLFGITYEESGLLFGIVGYGYNEPRFAVSGNHKKLWQRRVIHFLNMKGVPCNVERV